MGEKKLAYTSQVVTQIRDLRRKKEYSQEYMAFAMNISQNAYSKMELGKTAITLDRLYEMAVILDVEPAELLAEVKVK